MLDLIHGGKSMAHPGAMLKSIRAERGWTLAQVSERTGLPIATLSKIANDKILLSYDTMSHSSGCTSHGCIAKFATVSFVFPADEVGPFHEPQRR